MVLQTSPPTSRLLIQKTGRLILWRSAHHSRRDLCTDPFEDECVSHVDHHNRAIPATGWEVCRWWVPHRSLNIQHRRLNPDGHPRLMAV